MIATSQGICPEHNPVWFCRGSTVSWHGGSNCGTYFELELEYGSGFIFHVEFPVPLYLTPSQELGVSGIPKGKKGYPAALAKATSGMRQARAMHTSGWTGA